MMTASKKKPPHMLISLFERSDIRKHTKVYKSDQQEQARKTFVKRLLRRMNIYYARATKLSRSKRLSCSSKVEGVWVLTIFAGNRVAERETGNYVDHFLWCNIFWRAECDVQVVYGKGQSEIFLIAGCRKSRIQFCNKEPSQG